MSLQELIEALNKMAATVREAGLATDDVSVKLFGERGDPHRIVCEGNIGTTIVEFRKSVPE